MGSASFSEPSLTSEALQSLSGWDVAVRYHEFKSKVISADLKKRLRKISARAVLKHAQEVLGSVVRPMVRHSAPFLEVPGLAEQVDFDLEETLDQAPLAVLGAMTQTNYTTNPSQQGDKGRAALPISHADIWMGYSTHRTHPLVLAVDTSLSMTGEKLALTAVALAVVLLEFPEDPVGIVAFESEARVLKKPHERMSIDLLVERFLDVPAQGYTHLEDGMRSALQLIRGAAQGIGGGRPVSTVLLTDGKYTAGKDPVYLASRFPHLMVLKMGREKAGLELCTDLARKGHGALREVRELEALPGVMYSVVKDLLRGRSLA